MTRYVCLLRAINVGGQRKMKMAELRDLCESLGFADVTTYLQSGNVVLSTVAARSTLASKLAKAIGDKCGYAQITVLVRTAAELARQNRSRTFCWQLLGSTSFALPALTTLRRCINLRWQSPSLPRQSST